MLIRQFVGTVVSLCRKLQLSIKTENERIILRKFKHNVFKKYTHIVRILHFEISLRSMHSIRSSYLKFLPPKRLPFYFHPISTTESSVKRSEDMLPIVFYYHNACELHIIPQHPEQPGRVARIMKKLRHDWSKSLFREAPECSNEQLLRFHTEAHLRSMSDLFEKVTRNGDEDISKKVIKKEYIDSDTQVMWGTREAAYRAAGAVIAAVDDVFRLVNDPLRAR